MKISFIEPKPFFPGWTFGYLKKIPLIGQLYLGTILKNKGHDVQVFKETIKKLDFKKLEDSDVICISAISSQVPRAMALTKQFKKLFPDKKILVGGSHASFRPQDFPEADHVILGEGENIIIDLIEGKFKNKIVKGSFVENLNTLPFPDYSLVKGLSKSPKVAGISSSRGCPFNCNFCTATQMFGRKYRFRSPDNVLQEMLSLRKTKYFLFYDDNFCASKERAKEILRKMINAGTTFKWWAEARVDIAKDEELLKLIAESNNWSIAVGFESINPAVLKSMRKNQEYKDIVNCIKKLKDYGIRIFGFFISGTDYDDKNSYEQISNFVEKYELENSTFSVITPFYGTELFKGLDRQKRILTRNWGVYDTQHVVFKPKKMSAYELQKKQINALLRSFKFKNWWVKFWLRNFGDTINMVREFKKAHKANVEYLDFLKKADPR
jgi:radical SAM superfamily enzyme YgiQ (UPF0313 family)